MMFVGLTGFLEETRLDFSPLEHSVFCMSGFMKQDVAKTSHSLAKLSPTISDSHRKSS